jgi:single-strand DNA-binding protein
VEKYVHKGDRLFVEGKIQSRSYDDKQGVRRYVVEIMTENIDLLNARQTQQAAPTQATPTASNIQNAGNDTKTEDYPF